MSTTKEKAGTKARSSHFYEVDIETKALGHIRLTSHIPKNRPKQWLAFKADLDEMKRDHEWHEVLRAMQARRFTTLEVWEAYQSKKGAKSLDVDVKTKELLLPAMRTWKEQKAARVAPSTSVGRQILINRITKKYAKPTTRVRDLVSIIKRMKGVDGGEPGESSETQFNQFRAYSIAFLRDTLGEKHALTDELRDIKKYPKGKTKPKLRITPQQLREIVECFDTHADSKKGSRSADFMAMCFLGTNPKEFFEDGFTLRPKGTTEVNAPHVHITGEKTVNRDRDIPIFFPNALWPHATISPSAITQKPFALALKQVAERLGLDVTPYTARRSFATWLECAGIERSRREMYMGHSAETMTDHYERAEVTRHLVADGKRFRAWFEQELNQKPEAEHENAPGKWDDSPDYSPKRLILR